MVPGSCRQEAAGLQPPKTSRREFCFPREERLKRREDIGAVFKGGRRAAWEGAKLFALPNGLPRNRIAFVFSRKFGGAVERNRARRVGREAYRRVRRGLKRGFDLVFLVYPGEDTLKRRLEQFAALTGRLRLAAPGEPAGKGIS